MGPFVATQKIEFFSKSVSSFNQIALKVIECEISVVSFEVMQVCVSGLKPSPIVNECNVH